MTDNKNDKTKTKAKHGIKLSPFQQKLMARMVLIVFLLFVVTAVLVFGIVAILQSFWDINEDYNIWWYLLTTMVLSIIIGTVLTVITSNIIAKFTTPYIEAFKKVRNCDFSVRLAENSFFSEFHIAENFNAMVKQLAGVETLREEFISDFSHEFKTPIVSIAGFAKLLKDPNLSVSDRNEYLDVIIDESNRLVVLSENVLMLSRLDSAVPTAENFRLDEQIRQCVLLFCPEADMRHIELEVDCDKLEVTSSKKLTSQLWVNLLSNAVKFTPDGGKIVVSAKEEGNKIAVSVADSGCGMDEETQSHIFNKFYQGDKSRMTSGNGLGLSIVKKILEVIGGDIAVTSKTGVGSTFTVYLDKK